MNTATTAAAHVHRMRRNIVMIPTRSCTINLSKLTVRHVAGLVDLDSAKDITIIRKTASCIRIQCSSTAVKKDSLRWSSRSQAAELFGVIVREDLLPEERRAKLKLRKAMHTLFEAGFHPSWDRSEISWTHQGSTHRLRVTDVPEGASALTILNIAN